MQSIWIIYHKVFFDERVKRWIQSLCVCFWMFCTFILIFVFVFFRTSFAVLFRNAQLPLMRSKPSTPELYKFHSILLGALPFCKQAAGGTENGECQNEWHAKLYAIFIWKILNWFYAFSVCTHVCGRKSEGVKEGERA